MSFASQVKEEMTALEVHEPCCLHAQAYGLLLFGRSFSSSSIALQTESMAVAESYIENCSRETGATPKLRETQSGKKVLSVETTRARMNVISAFGHSNKNISMRINHANFSCDDCMSAFLRGVFLACGTVTTPEKDYHLEFAVPYLNLSRDLIKILMELELQPKQVVRKGYHVIYFKESESIEDVLTRMGATHAALELMGAKIYKDFRNKANRMANCETANISRMVEAAGNQLDAIRLIEKKKGLDYLPEELQELAKLRLEYPEASLRELSEMLSVSLTRSGVNHRLKKIQSIAEELI